MKEQELKVLLEEAKDDLDAIRSISSKQEIGLRLKRACQREHNRYGMKFTQDNLAHLLSKKSQTIGYFLRGSQGIHADDLAVICRLLGVSADEILFGTRSGEDSKAHLKIKDLENEVAQQKKVISVLLEGKS